MQDSLQQALQELVDRIARQVRADQVVDAFLAGGVATYMHLQKAGGSAAESARYSEDADLHFGRSLILEDLPVVAYKDRDGDERMLALDGSYTIDIGLRHPDCFDDAEFLFSSANGRVRLFLLNPMDLAVTKTGRFQDHDRADIESLARAGLLEAEAFRERATEALDYLATDPAMVRIHIDEAAELIAASSSSAPE
ncbi:DUF6036 family nucleotidyltransferase [Wenzhouxiangella marina]|uniref:Uncharacterized protein n=1 Tax=Wenzhouxiangella marina TaxID=1579979 RepID=A0A0K0XU13_9GAMM|nr:DUF6036 family nucleotidyltransferase [Wenzhouxiangella marina]AKS41173.1 hypothetical protein WM2015_792 [Wenzhouxiangella marina]MBB6088052.1 hypothetical protein [Wenzhouxiangella marina]